MCPLIYWILFCAVFLRMKKTCEIKGLTSKWTVLSGFVQEHSVHHLHIFYPKQPPNFYRKMNLNFYWIMSKSVKPYLLCDD